MSNSNLFRGNNKALISSINALLALDARGALAPHGIGEMARDLLETCASRLPAEQHQGEPVALPARINMTELPTERSSRYHVGERHGWNACLDEIAMLGPLYSHADPSDIRTTRQALESLKGEAQDLRAKIANMICAERQANEALQIAHDDVLIFKSALASLGEASKKLVLCARTTGGTAGPDQGLMDACVALEGVITLAGVARAIDECQQLRDAYVRAGDREHELRNRIAQLQADLTERDERIDQLEQQPRVPQGYALVPQSMLLCKEVIGVINFHCGDTDQEEGGQFGQYTDGRLWVGYVLDDDGSKVHGLHIATDEYPEEGSTTLVEFPAPGAEQEVKQCGACNGCTNGCQVDKDSPQVDFVESSTHGRLNGVAP